MRRRLLADFVEYGLNRLFQHLGEFVGLHPLPFLIVPLLITVVLSTGMFKGRLEDNLGKLYAPTGARCHVEEQAFQDFNNFSHAPHYEFIDVLFYVKEDIDENMLSNNRSALVVDFHNYVTKRLNYTFEGEEYNFGQHICGSWDWACKTNKQLTLFLTIHSNKNLSSNPNVHLEYPILEALGNKLFLGFHLLGVSIENNRSELIREAKLMRLNYAVDLTATNTTVEEFEAFVSALSAYADSVRGTHDVNIVFFSNRINSYEVQKNTIACVPFVAMTFFTLALFTILSTMTSNLVTSKPWEAVMGALTCLMAIASTFGLCFYCGLTFNSTVSVMPFLAFAIGIDDTFIALSAWHATDSSLPPHKRLGLSLRESGTAISVTSLTDVVLFGLCSLSSIPAITVFSIFTAVAMSFVYVYQLTFFTAIMAYGGRREERKINCFTPVCCWRKRVFVPEHPMIVNEDPLNIQFMQKKLTTKSNTTELIVSRLIRTKFAPFLNKPFVKISVFLLYLVYLGFAYYGVTQMKIDMSGSKIILDDSPLQSFYDIQKRYLWEYVNAAIIVRKAPDFRNETEQQLFESFLDDLESIPFSYGSGSTVLWYREYQDFIQYIDHTPDEFYHYCKEFLEIAVHTRFKGVIHWKTENGLTYQNDTNATIGEFWFTSGFTSLKKGWEGRVALIEAWRNISSQYPQYDVIIQSADNGMVDQYNTLDDETVQQVGIALLAMQGMAAIFIPHISSIFWIGWTLLSMDFGIVGILMMWGCDLDPIVMINIVMSLDFAVEYAAHMCHRYFVSKEVTEEEKVIDTLSAIGWPVLQGGLSAIIAVIPLVFVHSYIVRAFFKTVLLVVGIGLVHGLILLPVFVSTVSRLRYLPPKSVAKIRHQGSGRG